MVRSPIKRIGVLTGGGDAPGLNAVIRSVVKTANTFGIEVIGVEDGYEGLLKPGRTKFLTAEDVRGILPRGGTILGTSNRGNPFAFRVIENGVPVVRDHSQIAVNRIRELVDVMIVIGGDGSLTLAHRLYQMGAPVIGVPKTIDNDLSATDVTFGFDTALHTATDAIDKLHTTAEAHHRVMIVEVMGRNAGWIALEAGVAGGADVILIPEISYDPGAICDQIHKRMASGRAFSIVVVSEGVHRAGGDVVIREKADESGMVRLGGVSYRVAEEIKASTDQEVRVTVLGHLQRGGSPTPFDRILGTRFGAAAVRLAVEGTLDAMVALRSGEIAWVPLSAAIAQQKLVSPDSELVRVARDIGISFGSSTSP